MNKDKFEEAGDKERQLMTELFHQFGVTSYDFTESKSYDRIEGYYTGTTGTEYVFEVKVRANDSAAYNYNTIIEKSKVDYLIDNTKEIPHQPILFFFYTDNTCFYQRLYYDQYYSWNWIKAPKTTNGDTTKVWKEFVPFNINPNKLIKLN